MQCGSSLPLATTYIYMRLMKYHILARSDAALDYTLHYRIDAPLPTVLEEIVAAPARVKPLYTPTKIYTVGVAGLGCNKINKSRSRLVTALKQ